MNNLKQFSQTFDAHIIIYSKHTLTQRQYLNKNTLIDISIILYF